MENKAQTTGLKMEKKSAKSAAKHVTVRVKASARKLGRKVKLDDIFELAISLVTPEHLKMLQERSLTNENRVALLRQKYIEVHGQVGHDEFLGLMMQPEFAIFLKEYAASVAVSHVAA
jgi:hypothetical protein